MLNIIKKATSILLLSCSLFSQMETWHTTRFEKFWFSNFHDMKFREPIRLMPFNLKVGYIKYGGENYLHQWKKVIAGNENYSSNPLTYDGGGITFNNISEGKNRTMVIAEIDFMKYNFFSKKQNIIDVQFGFGYKFMKSLNGFMTNNEYFFKPEIDEYNFNSTFIFQTKQSRYFSLSYSIGYANADLYESSDGKATGHGRSQSYDIGFYFLRDRLLKNGKAHHGVELQFNKIDIDNINDPVSIIDAFRIEQVGLLYSYGIGYGGDNTLGDEAYNDLLNNDFISAVEKFQNFRSINNVKGRNKEIDEMIAFGIKQIPYQMFEKALEDYKKGYLEQSLWWLNKALPLADEYLIEKINQRRIIIISELLKGDFNNKDINTQIDIIKDLKFYDRKNEELNNKLSSLYIKKANYYLSKDNFFDSYFLYKEAMLLNPYNEVVISQNLKAYISKVLDYAYKYLQKNDYVIAYEILSLISEFANESDVTRALSNIAYNNIDDERIAELRKRIQGILYSERYDADINLSNIHLNQNYFVIVDMLGHPIEKVTKRRFDNIYDFATFKIADQNYNLFFKNKLLIDIERPK